MKKLVKILAPIVLIAAGYWGWSIHSKSDAESAPTTAAVSRGTIEETVLATGAIEAKQLVSIGARVSGQIETLAVKLGKDVAKGDLIAQIDSQDQQNDVLQAQASLANIEAQIAAKRASLRKAQLTLERQKELAARDVVSDEEVESAISDMLVLKAELKALEAQKSNAEVTVSTAKLSLERTKITAPIAGTVVAIVAEQGQTVNAASNTPTIVKLANLDQMVVKAEISEADVVHVVPGQKVSFTILGEPDTPYSAIVREIEPAPSEIETSDTISTDKAIYYNGLLDVDNPGHKLRIGMTTQVSIVLARAEGVLTVPASALSRANGSYSVQVYDSATGTIEVRPVEIGLNDKITAEIRSGLAEGELVVLSAAKETANSSSSSRMRPPPMGL